MQGGVGRQDAFGEALDHCAGEGEVLGAVAELSAMMFCVVEKRGLRKERVECEKRCAMRAIEDDRVGEKKTGVRALRPTSILIPSRSLTEVPSSPVALICETLLLRGGIL